MALTRRAFQRATIAGALSAARVAGANERIRIGAIGTGGRCQHLMNIALKTDRVEIAAVNDVLPSRMAVARRGMNLTTAREYTDFRKLLEDRSLDAVIVGSPDHWHVPMLVAAVDAGKDVYIEKPLTHTVAEGRQAIEAVRRTGRIVQVGYQQRSYPHIIAARQMIESGELGAVRLIQASWYQSYIRAAWTRSMPDIAGVDWRQWLGAAPPRKPDPLRYARWRWFWDYGGGTLTDLFSHWVDTIHWLTGDDVPLTAQASGGNFHFKEWECPDTLNASFRYPKGHLVTYESTLVQAFEDGGIVFRGDKATLKLDRGGYQLFTEESIDQQKTVRPAAAKSARALRDGTVDHMINFLDCVKSRKTPNADVESAVAAANAAHYGNHAYKTGQTVQTGRTVSPFRPLFDGRGLDNWIVDTPGLWAVRDGMIVGRHAGLKYNDFLRTRDHYEDFELRLKFRLLNGAGNSGVQFRSEPVAGSHEILGYQADIGEKYWGALYDESRRKRVLTGPEPEFLSALDTNAWHEYRILAQGNFIELRLDGVRTAHFIETENVLRRGFIALQVHSGPAIEVHFKDLEIREV